MERSEINRSLSALKECTRALDCGDGSHVLFRDLTVNKIQVTLVAATHLTLD
jgi:hypothetical protein